MPKTPPPPPEETGELPPREETLLESIASIATVLVAGLFVITFIFQNFEIPSASMTQTLLIGDHVLVDRITIAPKTSWMPLVHYRDVHRGDIIVFLKPGEPDLFLVKRVVGVPGDKLHLRNGIVYLNGVAQTEPQAAMPVDDGNPDHSYQAYRDDFPSIPTSLGNGVTETWALDLPTHIQGDDLVVPQGKYFAMGDNRLDSLDGRYWGFVPRENIVGRPLFVYWSFKTPADQMDKQSLSDRFAFMFHIIIHFFDGTRWTRTLHLIK
ncbi:MAG TPA: signal peptidase I [Acidobacteriaceae bacterium]